MATLKQIRANRLNAQNCAGPSSAEGKARSSSNALKSGIHAEAEVLPWENPDERAALRAEYYNHHQPSTPEQRAVVDNLIHGEFLNRRFRRAEVEILIAGIPDGADTADQAVIGKAYSEAGAELGRLQRRIDANNRNFHRDLDELRLLQAEQPSFEPPPPPPLVLVPSQPEPPAVPEPAFEAPPAVPQPQVAVLEGLRGIVTRLSQDRAPDQLATLTLAQAAALHPPAPGPRFLAPSLSTAQPPETKAQTEQLASFRQNPETAPRAGDGPLPAAPASVMLVA